MNPQQHCAQDNANDISAPVAVTALDVGGAHGKLAARLYARAPGAADGKRAARLIVFFPCGGFARSMLDECDRFMTALARRSGCNVLATTYTPAGALPFPAAAEDAHAVLRWAVAHRAALGWSGAELIVAGVEAGGNLAAVAALMARDRGGPALRAQILMMPMLDPSLTTCSMRGAADAAGAEGAQQANACARGYRRYLQHAADHLHPYASPLHISRIKGLPPALILSAENDPLRDEAEQYGARLIAAGVKTLVLRLPPFELAQDNGRCNETLERRAVQEATAFIAGLGSA